MDSISKEFAQYESELLRHFDTHLRGRGERWEQQRHAYQLGIELAQTALRGGRYREWSELEPVARQRWEASNLGRVIPYRRAQTAIRRGYELASTHGPALA